MSLSHRVTEIWENSYDNVGKTFGFMSKDNAGRTSMNTVFGEATVGQRIPSISIQFMYETDDRNVRYLSANGGSITYTDKMLAVNSGVAIDGDGIFETKKTVRYVPGHESYCLFTTVFDEPVLDNRLEVGLYEENNGFWIGYIDTDFVFVRIRDGVEYVTKIEDFDSDIINGNNEFNYILNPQKGNIWKISYAYSGFDNITLEVLCDCGRWLLVHSIPYVNLYEVTHITNTYLPFRARSINSGNNTSKKVKIGSIAAGIIDGGSKDVTGRRFSASVPATSTGTNTPIALFRNKSTFKSISNYVESKLLRISISTDGAQPVTLQILKGATITNTPTWTDVDANNSIHEYSVDATVDIANAYQIVGFELAKSQNYIEDVKDIDIHLYTGETALFLANGANNVKISLNWIEDF